MFLVCSEAWGVSKVESECHPGAHLVHVLTSRTTAARGGEVQLIFWNRELISYPDHRHRLAIMNVIDNLNLSNVWRVTLGGLGADQLGGQFVLLGL